MMNSQFSFFFNLYFKLKLKLKINSKINPSFFLCPLLSLGLGLIQSQTLAQAQTQSQTLAQAQPQPQSQPQYQTQTQSQSENSQTQYLSAIDEALTIHKVTLLPVQDNLDNIYAQPIQEHLLSVIENDPQWSYVPLVSNNPDLRANDLDENPSLTQQLLIESQSDAIITTQLIKGAKGISITMKLLLRFDGQVFLSEQLRNYSQFSIHALKAEIKTLYHKLKNKLPYEALILSRFKNQVTINLGTKNGIETDQIVNVIQILQLKRHPKLKFIVGTDTEILGKIKITKVDDTLSFGLILSEKERGLIKKNFKIGRIGFVQYTHSELEDGNGSAKGLSDRLDGLISFGKNPKEWVPKRPPSFGKVSFSLGLGSYQANENLRTAGSVEGRAAIYPSLDLYGELWINPRWILGAELRSGIISTPNNLSNSTPSNLNHAMNRYDMTLGYNILFDDFWGPKLGLRLGLFSYSMNVDNSEPTAFTSKTYSGYLLGLIGSFPIDPQKIWTLGSELFVYFNSNLSEKPVSSGSSSSTINHFNFFVNKKLSEHFSLKGTLNFQIYRSTYSGSGTRNCSEGTCDSGIDSSQRHTLLLGGIEYYF